MKTKTDKIWTVCTINTDSDLNRVLRKRTWGFEYSLEKAEIALQNACSDEAGYYTHAIIESFAPGLYAIAGESYWFAWDDINRDWKSCEKPKSEANIINYGMG